MAAFAFNTVPLDPVRARLRRAVDEARWPICRRRWCGRDRARGRAGDLRGGPVGAMQERAPRLTRAAFRLFRPIATRWIGQRRLRARQQRALLCVFRQRGERLAHRAGPARHRRRARWSALVAETGCTYFESVAFPDALEAGIAVARLGRSSVRYRVGDLQGRRRRGGAQGHFVHVYVERATGRPVDDPGGRSRGALGELVAGAVAARASRPDEIDQERDQRLVGRRHRIVPQRLRPHPFQRLPSRERTSPSQRRQT